MRFGTFVMVVYVSLMLGLLANAIWLQSDRVPYLLLALQIGLCAGAIIGKHAIRSDV
jgi:hypothetical protein